MKKAMKQSVLTSILNAGVMFIIILAAISFFSTTYFNNQIDIANSDRFLLMRNAKRFIEASAYLTAEVRNYAVTGDIEHYNNYWNEVNNLKNREAGITALKDIGLTAEEEAIVTKMLQLSNNLIPLESQAMEMAKAKNNGFAIEAVFGKSYELVEAEIRTLQHEFLTILDNRAAANVSNSLIITTVAEVVVWVLLAAVVIVQIISILIIRKKIIKPVKAIQKEMLEIAQGNLSMQSKLEPDTSEIGMLVNSIHQAKENLAAYVSNITYAMSEFAKNSFILQPPSVEFKGDFMPIVTSVVKVASNMTDTINNIKTAAHQVSAGSGQVSDSAQALAQGATEQASSIEELSATINIISNQVKLTAQNANKAVEISTEASQAIIAGNNQMQKLMSAMDNINHKSAEISKIIKTIEDIAFQTNILALNAAVEAARAGAAGKGFAVVADEVRNLAGKSADAAKNTTALIQESVSAINEGVRLAQVTAQDLLNVVDGVKETTDVIAGITRAAKEQADSISEITIGVDQISSVV